MKKAKKAHSGTPAIVAVHNAAMKSGQSSQSAQPQKKPKAQQLGIDPKGQAAAPQKLPKTIPPWILGG